MSFFCYDRAEFHRRIEWRGHRVAFPHPMVLEELLDILILVNLDRSIVPVFDFDTEKLLCNSQILHFKPFAKALFNCVDDVLVFSRNNEVIDIKGDIRFLAVSGIFMNPNAGIGFTLLEVKIRENFCNEVEPCARGLFQSV